MENPPEVHLSEDPDDNKFLACAIKAKAEAVVSNDSDLLNLKEVEGIRIVKPSQFL